MGQILPEKTFQGPVWAEQVWLLELLVVSGRRGLGSSAQLNTTASLSRFIPAPFPCLVSLSLVFTEDRLRVSCRSGKGIATWKCVWVGVSGRHIVHLSSLPNFPILRAPFCSLSLVGDNVSISLYFYRLFFKTSTLVRCLACLLFFQLQINFILKFLSMSPYLQKDISDKWNDWIKE